MMDDHLIFLTTQRDMNIDEPTQEDFYEMGTLTKVKQMLKLPNGTIRVLVEGIEPCVDYFISLMQEDFYEVTVKEFHDDEG